MEPGRERSGVWRDVVRDVAFTLVAFALALQVLLPSGLMVSTGQDGQGVIIICTGHGALSVVPDDGKAPAPAKKKSDAPCAFAGHAAPFTAPLAAAPAEAAFALTPESGARPLASLTPGRGLAAPPPPARGPPSLRI
jgi:hypothetical protein